MNRIRHATAVLKIAVTLLLLHVLYARIDAGALAARLGGLRWGWVAAFGGLLLANTALSTLKWRMLLSADGIRMHFGSLLASYWIGSFFNVFLPSTIGGDAYRIADIGRRSARAARTAASVMADRLSGFLALALYGLCLFPSFRRTYSADPRLLLLPAAALAGLLLLGFLLWEGAWLRRGARWLPAAIRPRAEQILATLLDTIRVYTARRSVLAGILAISFLFQFFAIAAVHCLGRATGLDLPLRPFGFFVPFISLMEMIPVSIFGIGLRDTGYVWFMLSVGRTRADAAALSVLYVAATVVYVSIGGLLYLGRALAGAPRPPARHALSK